LDRRGHRGGAARLADAADRCCNAIRDLDRAEFGRAVREGFDAQVAMFPNMKNDMVAQLIDQYRDKALGWKLSGAGGGGYLVLVSDKPIVRAVRIKARRPG